MSAFVDFLGWTAIVMWLVVATMTTLLVVCWIGADRDPPWDRIGTLYLPTTAVTAAWLIARAL